MLQVVWFKRDFRLADHRPLLAALSGGPVLLLYVDEPELWEQADSGPRHRRAVLQALRGLQAELLACGAGCTILFASMLDALTMIESEHGAFRLWSHEETGNGWSFSRDVRVADWCRARGYAWHEIPQNGVIRRLHSRNGWARAWEERMHEPLAVAPAVLPNTVVLPGYDPGRSLEAFADRRVAWASAPSALAVSQQRADRAAAMVTLESFLQSRGRTYARSLSSPLTAFSACSRLSVALAYGSISLREVVHATRARIATIDDHEPGGVHFRRSLRAFVARLHWHCHFMQKLESQPNLEFKPAHRAYAELRAESFDVARYTAWATGTTGLPFVDACMRALLTTGWLNFRMRAMLCAVASYHLWLPWREPALHLARAFTDYEPGIHYGQIQMQSGTSGVNTVRLYNPIKQGLDHDPHGKFIRRFCPELEKLPTAAIHEPWKLAKIEAEKYGFILGTTYPEPIVDHLAAARAARDKVWGVRKSDSYQIAAAAILERHGSRKSGIRQVGDRPRSARKRSSEPTQAPQLRLFDEE